MCEEDVGILAKGPIRSYVRFVVLTAHNLSKWIKPFLKQQLKRKAA